MSYHKQLQKQKRKHMAMEKEKLNRQKNDAYSQSGPANAWKTLFSLIVIAVIVYYSVESTHYFQ